MQIASNCMNDITRAITMQTVARENFSLDLERNLFSGPAKGMQCLRGESSSTTPVRQGLIAPCSAMRAEFGAATSFDRRTQLLIASGLVAGITPLSKRKRLPQETLDFASSQLAGDAAERQNQDCLFLSVHQ